MRIPKSCSLLAASAFAGLIACAGDTVSFPVTPAEEFTATLSGAEEAPTPVATAATGSAVFAVINDTLMSWRVDVSAMDSITASHIHAGAAGVAGPVIVNLFAAPTTGCTANTDTAMTIVSSSAENPTKITTIGPHRMTGTPLVRIAGHTGSVPALNGVYTATVLTTTSFSLPVDVTTPGTGGTARPFSLINISSPRCRASYSGGLAQAQIRPASLTVAAIQSYGTTPQERWDSLLVLMRTGNVYVNVHTVQNSGGEIRGQLNPR